MRKYLLKNEKTKTYLPIEGDPFFLETVGQLVFGADFFAAHQERLAAIQAIGGAGALKLAGAFLNKKCLLRFMSPTPPGPIIKEFS